MHASLSAFSTVHLFMGPIDSALAAVVVANFAVKVPAASAPVISVGVVQDNGVLIVEGTVTQKGATVEGLTVQIGGAFAKYHLTATVLKDRASSESMLIPAGGIEGTVTAQTHGTNGLASNVAQCWAPGGL